MRELLYEVAAVTPYTERSQIYDFSHLRIPSAPPISALFTTKHDSEQGHSHIESWREPWDIGQASQVARLGKSINMDTSSTLSAGGQSSSCPSAPSEANQTFRHCNDSSHSNFQIHDSRQFISEVNSGPMDLSHRDESTELHDYENVYANRTNLGGANVAADSAVEFARAVVPRGYSVDSTSSWGDNAHRESTSSWWGASSTVSVSNEFGESELPLLASTMLEHDRHQSSDADVEAALNAMDDPEVCVEDQAESAGMNGFKFHQHEVKIDENANIKSNFLTQEVSENHSIDKFREKDSESAPETGYFDDPSRIGPTCKECVSEDTPPPTPDQQIPTVKSYRDVLLSAPSTTHRTGRTLPTSAQSGSDSDFDQQQSSLLTRALPKHGKLRNSTAQRDSTRSSTDAGMTSSGDSSADIYITAQSRLLDSGDDVTAQSRLLESGVDVSSDTCEDHAGSCYTHRSDTSSCGSTRRRSPVVSVKDREEDSSDEGGVLADVESSMIFTNSSSNRSRHRARTAQKSFTKISSSHQCVKERDSSVGTPLTCTAKSSHCWTLEKAVCKLPSDCNRNRSLSNMEMDGLVSSRDSSRSSMDGVVSSRDSSRNSVDGVVSSRDSSRNSVDGVVSSRDSSRNSVDGVVSSRDSSRNSLDGVVSSRDSSRNSVDGVVSSRDNSRSSVDGVVSSRDSSRSSVDGVVSSRDSSRSSVDGVVSSRDSSRSSVDGLVSSRDSSCSRTSSASTSSSSLPEQEKPKTKLNPNCPPFVPRAARQQVTKGRVDGDKCDQHVTEMDPETSLTANTSSSRINDEERDKMPPPNSTIVRGQKNPSFREQVLSLRNSFGDSGIQLDLTGQNNVSSNISQTMSVPTPRAKDLDDKSEAISDSVFHSVDASGINFKVELSEDLTDKNILSYEMCCGSGNLQQGSFTKSEPTKQFQDQDHQTLLTELATNRKDTWFDRDFYQNEHDKLYFVRDNFETPEHALHSLFPPFDCGLDHQLDFVSPKDLTACYDVESYFTSLNQIPKVLANPCIARAIVSLSQRIVRLRVKKAIHLIDVDSKDKTMGFGADLNESLEYDHYGTGFVCFVNNEYFEIRTHEAVVANIEEASHTEVTFELLIPNGNKLVLCVVALPGQGQTDCEISAINYSKNEYTTLHSFHKVTHSQATQIRMATPRGLARWLHIFESVPVWVRKSLFTDSCYFTDSSPETSLVDGVEHPTASRHSSDHDHRSEGNHLGEDSVKDFDNLQGGFSQTSYTLLRKSDPNSMSGDLGQVCHREVEEDRWKQRDNVIVREPTPLHFEERDFETEQNKLQDTFSEAASVDFSWDRIVEQTGAMADTFPSVESDLNGNLYKNIINDSADACHNNENTDRLGHGITHASGVFDITSINNKILHGNRVAIGEKWQQQKGVSDSIKESADNVGLIHHGVEASGGHELVWKIPRQFDSQPIDSRVSSTLSHDSEVEGHFSKTPGASCPGRKQSKIFRDLIDKRPSSPLVIMERRAATRGRATMSGVGECPYKDVDVFGSSGSYTCFSSYTGDVLDTIRNSLFPETSTTVKSTDPTTADSTDPTTADSTDPTTAGSTDPTTADSTDPTAWSYERLLYTQNNYRSDYNRLFRDSLTKRDQASRHRLDTVGTPTGTCTPVAEEVSLEEEDDSVFVDSEYSAQTGASDKICRSQTVHSTGGHDSDDFRDRRHRSECDHKGLRRVFAPTDPFLDLDCAHKYLESWNTDLLNLDKDLQPLPDFQCVDSMVKYVLDENDSARETCCLTPRNNVIQSEVESTSTDQSLPEFLNETSGSDVHAILISHPHGGPKMVSTGFFSRHSHIGGDLYDTPTCMGSCGAPVLSLGQDGYLHVTNLVHSGTVQVNEITTGIGVSSFEII